MIEISNSVLMMPAGENDRPVLGYVRGNKRALMIDAGNSAAHARLFMEKLDARCLPRPELVALTHWHWDHVLGLHAIDAVSIACAQTNRYIEQMMAWTWTEAAMQARLKSGEDTAFCDEFIRLEYPDRSKICAVTAELEFADELQIDLGGIRCIAMRIANPHSLDSVMYLVPEEGVLFVGDAAYPGGHHGISARYAKLSAQFLKLLTNLDFRVCVTGHGELQTKEAFLADLASGAFE